MKSLLGGLLFLALGVVAHATPFAGQYYAITSSQYGGGPDAGLTITVKDDGTFTARGLSESGAITAHGNVKDNGTIIFKETYSGTPYKHKGKFTSDSSFYILLAYEDIDGGKITAAFPAAGLYSVTSDEGDGFLVIDSDGNLDASIYGIYGDYEIQGDVDGSTLTGESTDGRYTFTGKLSGGRITGTYSDYMSVLGDFSAVRY